MDPAALLDINTPFDDQKQQLLDNREIANKLLNEFKTLPNSWTYCDAILTKSQSVYTKVIALGILEDVVRTKWNILTPDQKLGIRNFLIDLLIKHVTDDNIYLNTPNITHLLNKFNLIIVLIAKHEWTSTWPTFISEICTSSQSNQNLCENNLKMLQMLNEEINEFWKNSMTTSKALELKAMMAKEFKSVFDLCLFIFENSANVKQTLIIEAVKLFADNVKWFPVEYIFREDILSRFLNDMKTMAFLRVQIMKCFSEIYTTKMSQEQYMSIKNITMQIFKSYINEVMLMTKSTNFAERYQQLNVTSRANFEDLCLQFALSLISFFKNNFAYIEMFDFQVGTQSGNEFTSTYMSEANLGLNYLAQIHQIPNEEIFKSISEFWQWFCFKVVFLQEKEADPDQGFPLGAYTNSLSNFIAFTHEMFFFKNYYISVLEIVRRTLITKMTKPIEVKIDIDEDGEIVMDQITNTVYQSLHETMRDCLIYLTHLDPYATEKIMLDTLQTQTIESYWNPMLLNSLCWSIGCITGSMEELHEKKFVVMVIKYLLNLCEMKKGKTNKAVVASNIMYVVGQYPRFLNAHWKFLKTVIKKLFEFMHELHPGVQDFACETFLKISIKCGEQVVVKNEGEVEPYINSLVRSIKEDTADLQAHQKLMFYEAIGNMIAIEPDYKTQCNLIQIMMQQCYSDWSSIFDQANANPEILQNNLAIKALDIIIKLSEKTAASTKTAFWSYATYIYENLMKAYVYYTTLVNDAYRAGQFNLPALKLFKSIKRTILKFIQTLIKSNQSTEIIMTQILPPLSNMIEQYRDSHIDNRDPDVLLIFSELLDKLKNAQYDYISSIWQYLCLFTLDMIKTDFQSYPEHRMNFFTLLKSLISNAFDALFTIQDANFNKDVLNAIIWAFRHDQPLMYETGLETLLTLIKNINEIKISNGINIADPFYNAFYIDLLQEIFCVLTDSFHKSGFKLQVEILLYLISVVEMGHVSEHIFDANIPNKNFVVNYLINLLSKAFSHLNKLQIETFCLALFNKCYNFGQFKVTIRDFLTTLKSFSGDNDDLFEEEKKAQIAEANLLEEKKRNFIPGMAPVYDVQTQQKISSTNYQQQDTNFTG